MMQPEATLANWRTPPYSRWSFQHVDHLIPTAPIVHAAVSPLDYGKDFDTDAVRVTFEDRTLSIDDVLHETQCDGLLILCDGTIAHESYRNGDPFTPHILFSVSKSVTAMLAGVLVADGKLDPEAPVTQYVPEAASSAFGTATVWHVLDMTVDVTFVEDYLDTEGAFARYRAATGWNPPNPVFGSLGLHAFLCTLPRANEPHGYRFHYVSPNTDLLGWIIERAGGAPLATQISKRIWQPLGAECDAYITIDPHGAPRAAGGICTTLRDLARFGEMVRRDGFANGRQIVPSKWIEDIQSNGDPKAWQRGSMPGLFPNGHYRSQWYATDRQDPALCAIGIHGQWVYVNRTSGLVIVKTSSQDKPLDERADRLNLALFEAVRAAMSEHVSTPSHRLHSA